MKISYNKLKSYMPALPAVDDLVQQIIFHAFEVEEVEKLPPLSPADSSPQAGEQDYMLDIKVLPDRAFDAKTEEGMVKEISVITGAPCDREKIEQMLGKLGGVEHDIFISTKEVEKKLGMDISVDEISKIFERFWYAYEKEGDDFKVTIPAYRPDLVGAHDLIDEIIRIHGYEYLPSERPEIDFTPQMNETFAKINWARNKLLSDGYNEVMTYSFQNSGEVEVLASASDKSFLRTNLSDGLKESANLNTINAPFLGLDTVKIFEIGTVFLKDKPARNASGIADAGGEIINIAFGDKKKITEISLDEYCKELPPPRHDLGRGTPPQAGGEFHPRLVEEGAGGGDFVMWSLYPFIARDIAVWADENVLPEVVEKIIKENAGSLLIKEPRLFDTFKKEGKISYAFRLVFQSKDKTLTDEEVSIPMQKITEKLVENGFVIR